MQGIHIVATGRALPKKKATNQDLGRMVDTYDEWIVARTGISQRHFCSKEETCSGLAIEAARKAVKQAVTKEGIDIEEIGVVVVATSTSDYILPSTACLIQKALGLSQEIIAFDLSAACSGFLYGLQVCKGLLQQGNKRYALLVGCEQLSRILNFTDRSSCILFGDGAGAAIIELDDSLFVHKSWSAGDIEPLSCRGVGFNNAKVVMDGKAVFKFATKALKQAVDEVLEKADMTMDDVDYVICHQANRRIIEHVIKKFPEHEYKFYINIDKYANTSAASIPIVMDEMLEQKILKPGMKVLAVGFGAGLTWGGALFTV